MDRLNIHRGCPTDASGEASPSTPLPPKCPLALGRVVHEAERSLLHGLTDNHEYTYAIGTMYMDIVQECEKLGDYIVNVVESRMGVKQSAA